MICPWSSNMWIVKGTRGKRDALSRKSRTGNPSCLGKDKPRSKKTNEHAPWSSSSELSQAVGEVAVNCCACSPCSELWVVVDIHARKIVLHAQPTSSHSQPATPSPSRPASLPSDQIFCAQPQGFIVIACRHDNAVHATGQASQAFANFPLFARFGLQVAEIFFLYSTDSSRSKGLNRFCGAHALSSPDAAGATRGHDITALRVCVPRVTGGRR
jgi:hypothetical protein